MASSGKEAAGIAGNFRVMYICSPRMMLLKTRTSPIMICMSWSLENVVGVGIKRHALSCTSEEHE